MLHPTVTSTVHAAAQASTGAANKGLVFVVGVLLIAFTIASQRLKWYHTLSLVMAGILLGGATGAYESVLGWITHAGNSATAVTK